MELCLELMCQGLAAQGHQVTAVVADSGCGGAYGSDLPEQRDGVCVIRSPRIAQLAGTSVCPRMASTIRQQTADVIHLHWPNPTAAVAFLASGQRAPLVISFHSDVIRQKFLGAVFQPILSRLLERASAILVAAPQILRHSPVLGPYRGKCRVVPFGIRTVSQYGSYRDQCGQSDQRAQVQKIRERFGSSIVLAVGRQVYYKGFEYLIRAMQRVPGRAILIGDGPLRGSLEQFSKKLGVSDRVTFLGEVDNVAPYYRAADVFVLPSVARSEAFGMVQLEAMAAGTPVINTALDSGVPYVSVHGETGITVAPKDETQLADAIALVLQSKTIRTLYGQAAQRRVAQEFTAEVMTRRIQQVYEDVVHQAGKSSRTKSAQV